MGGLKYSDEGAGLPRLKIGLKYAAGGHAAGIHGFN